MNQKPDKPKDNEKVVCDHCEVEVGYRDTTCWNCGHTTFMLVDKSHAPTQSAPDTTLREELQGAVQLNKNIRDVEDRYIAKGIPSQDETVKYAVKALKLAYANDRLSEVRAIIDG